MNEHAEAGGFVEGPLFVALQGIDGTGKTTLSKVLARTLDRQGIEATTYDAYCHENAVINPFSSQKDDVKTREIDAQYEFFLYSAAFKSSVVRHALKSGTTIIADRWIADVHAHHMFAGASPPRLMPAGLLAPDVTVLLVSEEAERIKRISARRKPTADDLIPKEPGTRAMFFENYLLATLRERDMVLDTTRMTSRKSAQHIISRYFS